MQQTNEKKGTGQMNKDQQTETEKNKQADKNKQAGQGNQSTGGHQTSDRHPTTGHHPADKEVTGQQHSSNNDGAPVHPMHKAKPVEQQSKKEEDKENMGSGKRKDDN